MPPITEPPSSEKGGPENKPFTEQYTTHIVNCAQALEQCAKTLSPQTPPPDRPETPINHVIVLIESAGALSDNEIAQAVAIAGCPPQGNDTQSNDELCGPFLSNVPICKVSSAGHGKSKTHNDSQDVPEMAPTPSAIQTLSPCQFVTLCLNSVRCISW